MIYSGIGEIKFIRTADSTGSETNFMINRSLCCRLKECWYLLITLFLISDEAYTIATISDSAQMILVLEDDLGLTKKPNPCKLVPPANSFNTFKTTISRFRS